MSKTAQRTILGRGKGYLNAVGPQSRFIIFLIFLLMGYTLLLRVLQKLAEILQLPVFLPFSLISLLLFIGIAGTVYSHTVSGPLIRIRKAIDQLAQGDRSVSLSLRESDDPLLKQLVDSISHLSEHFSNSHGLVRAAALDLSSGITALAEAVEKGANRTEIRPYVDSLREKQALLEKTIQSLVQS